MFAKIKKTQPTHFGKMLTLGAVLATSAALLAGCAKDQTMDAGLPEHKDWKPILQTEQKPVATYYVNTKLLQKDGKNYQGVALMQPIGFEQVGADGAASLTEQKELSLVWKFALNCETKKLESRDFAIVKGLFAQGEAASVNVENPYKEDSDIGQALIKQYCK